METQAEKYDVVEAWISNVQYAHTKSPRTAQHYREAIQHFTQWLNTTPEAIVKEYEEINDEKQFKRKYGGLLRSYISYLSSRGLASGTIHTAIAMVRSFFKYNDLPLSFLPSGKQRVTFHNRDITKEEIEAVLKISNPRERAFFIMLAQSGLRPDTLCQLRLKDIEPDFSNGVIPCRISVPQQMTKGEYSSYFTFMGQEGVDALKSYLNKRSDVGPESLLFTKIKEHGQHTIIRISPNTMSNHFRNALRRLREKGVLNYEIRVGDRRGKPNELRLYCLRKYFKNNANTMGSEYTEFLMGHTTGVTGHYISKDVEFYRKLYAEKAMPHLRLGAPTPTEAEKEIQKIRTTTESEMKAMNQMIGQLSQENKTLREQYQQLLEMFQQFKESKKK